MSQNIKSMTSGTPGKLILTFALPLMAGNVFQQLYTVVDTAVVGKFLGVSALAALGAADWLNWMMLGIAQGFTQGFGIKMAQEFGAEDHKNLRRTVGCAGILAALSSLLLVLFGLLVARPVLILLQTPEAILEFSLLYLRILFIGLPVVMMYNLFACVLRALGDSRTPLVAMVVASLTNIALDLLFVLVFGMGIAGAAIATVLAQMVSGVFCLYHIRRIDILKLSREDFSRDPSLSGKLMVLGAPMAFQNAIIAVGGMIVQSVVNSFGVIFIAGFTATNKLYGLLEIAATSYGYAMVTYTGQNLGAGRYERIRLGIRAALAIAMATSVLIAVIMLSFGKLILGCFISGTPEEFNETLKIAYFYLAIMSVCLPVLYVLHVVRSTIQGMGNTVLPMVSGIVEFLMRTLTAILLPLAIGETGIYFAEIMAWLGADVVLVLSYISLVRKLPHNTE